MVKFKIEYERSGCIGAAACEAIAPDFWKIVEDGKADLITPTTDRNNKEVQEGEIDEKDLDIMKQSAEGCPVNVIHIINKETGEKII